MASTSCYSFCMPISFVDTYTVKIINLSGIDFVQVDQNMFPDSCHFIESLSNNKND